MSILTEKITKTIEKWKNFANLEPNLKEELDSLNEEQLFDAFYTNLEFGTGGMRGVIGVGTNRMNIYVLRMANYGYAKFINSRQKNNPSVVIAYDSRHKSVEFAKESARVLCSYGIKVYLFDKITPTPELSFAVRYLKATGGIVVTASHNPPQYNGYKIYDETGCQLVPELAEIVISEIANSPDPFNFELKSYEELINEGMIEIVSDNIDRPYLEAVKSVSVVNDFNKDDFKIVFSPLHGTAAYLGEKLLSEMGYTCIPVKEQMVPDSNFSTVVLPNPEDKRAFELSVAYAKKNNADICIATDPDADRVGLAVKNGDDYILLNGNQTGALLIYYLASNKKISKKGVVFNTIVTSSLGVEIAKSFGMEYFSTLTGFKFIGEQARLLENVEDKEFFFGYEESYGYVIKDFVRDKDSLQALLLCSEMSCYYKNQGKSLLDVLEEIYKKYGYYQEDLVNIGLTGAEGAAKINRILDHFRNVNELNSEALKVVAKEDYKLKVRYDLINNQKTALTLPVSNVIKYFLDDNSWFVLRPSGTEPKMKVYISSCAKSKEEVLKRVEEIKKEVLQIVNTVE